MPDGHGGGARRRRHVAPGEDARLAGHHGRGQRQHAVLDGQRPVPAQEGEVGVLTDGQHQRVGVELLELPGRSGHTVVVGLHPLDGHPGAGKASDGRQPPDGDPFGQRRVQLLRVGRHPVPGAAVEDDGVGGPQATGRAGRVDRGVPAAVDDHPSAEPGCVARGHAVQQCQGVHHPRRVAGRDVDPTGQLGPDSQEDGVVVPGVPLGADIGHRPPEFELHPQVDDPLDLGGQDIAGQPVGRDPVVHHPPGLFGPVDEVHRVAEAAEVVGGTEAGRPRTDHQDPRPGRGPGPGQGPPVLEGQVAEEPLHAVDADGLVELCPVARRLTRVEADAPHHRRERIRLDQQAPRRLVVAGLGVVEPALDVLAGRARAVARGLAVDVDGTLHTPRAGAVGVARPDVEGDGERALHGQCSPSVAGASDPTSP